MSICSFIVAGIRCARPLVLALAALGVAQARAGVTFSFDTGPQGFTVTNPNGPFDGPWTYGAAIGVGGTGGWSTEGQAIENVQRNTTDLTSPILLVPSTGTRTFSFDHRYSFEDAVTAWDGGAVFISVNGGPFTQIPGSAFTSNGYTGTITASSNSALQGLPAFTSSSPGYGAGTFIHTTIDVGPFTQNDTLQIRFRFAGDTNTSGGSPDWVIDNLDLGGVGAAIACCDPITAVCEVSIVSCRAGTVLAPGGGTDLRPFPCPFPGAPGVCDTCAWLNGPFDSRTGQASHLGGAIPNGAKAADDFTLCEGFVYQLNTISATLLTTTFPGLVKPKAELWSDCNGCPGQLLYTFDRATVVESGQDAGPAFDGRPLRIVHVSFDTSNQLTVANRYVALKGGQYWLSVYGQTDGLGPSMQMYDVTYWGTTAGEIKGKPAYKIDGNPSAVYNVFNFSDSCGPTGWHSVVDDCCIGCTDLNFSFCATSCKILVDNGGARRQIAAEAVGSTSRFAENSLSATETRSADDFVLPGCQDYRICYVEACVLTNCTTFEGIFEYYENDCNKPSYALHGQPLGLTPGGFATKIIPLNYTAFMDGKTVSAYRLEFHDVFRFLTGGRQYWLSVGVRSTFSINERAYFCYNADCSRSCLIRWNEGRVLTATTLDDHAAAHGCTSATVCNGWAKVGNDFSFLIAGDGVTTPGPINSQPSCTADYNRDGSLSVQDVFDYISSWFTGCP